MSICAPTIMQTLPIRWPLRLYMLVNRIRPDEALNCAGYPSSEVSEHIAAYLKQVINRLQGEGIDVQTGRVDYSRLANSPTFSEYQRLTHALQRFDPSTLSSLEERLAFWINLYNTLTIHAVIFYGVRRSITEIRGIFDRAAYIIGGLRFSLNDIEHGILRANAGHPALPGSQFSRHDPRYEFVLPHLDPRIHFTLVCASVLCPPIGVYQTENIDQQLTLAAHNFLMHGGLKLNKETMTVSLSRLFSWYASDFGGSLLGYRKQGNLLRGIAPFMPNPDEREFILQHADRLKVQFQKYNWLLNV